MFISVQNAGIDIENEGENEIISRLSDEGSEYRTLHQSHFEVKSR